MQAPAWVMDGMSYRYLFWERIKITRVVDQDIIIQTIARAITRDRLMIIFRNSPQEGNSLLIGSLEQWDQGSRALLWGALNKLYSPNPFQSLGTPDYSVFPSTFPANVPSRWWNRHTVLVWSPSVNGSKQQAVRRTLIGDYVIQPN